MLRASIRWMPASTRCPNRSVRSSRSSPTWHVQFAHESLIACTYSSQSPSTLQVLLYKLHVQYFESIRAYERCSLLAWTVQERCASAARESGSRPPTSPAPAALLVRLVRLAVRGDCRRLRAVPLARARHAATHFGRGPVRLLHTRIRRRVHSLSHEQR